MLKNILFFFIIFQSSISQAQPGGFNAQLAKKKCETNAVLQFTTPTYRMDSEGTTNIPFQITMSTVQNCDTIVYLKFFGTAINGTSYTPISSEIVIPKGQTIYNGSYSLNENVGLTDLWFTINLAGTPRKSITLGANDQIQQWIEDNDSPLFTDTERFRKVATSSDHTCGINVYGELSCWGLGANGRLGTGGVADQTAPLKIEKHERYSDISAGPLSTCGITNVGVLKCWGENGDNQLGDGSTTMRTSPVVISAGTTFNKVSLGQNHGCAIATSGELYCWGKNDLGQVGDGTTINKSTPTLIDSGVSYLSVSAGGDNIGMTKTAYTCGLTTSNELKCWGFNGSGSGSSYGMLGDGTYLDKLTPTVIDSGVSYISISAGNLHTCGVTSGNVLKCWGANDQGQLGLGATSVNGYNTPQIIDSGVAYKSVSVSELNTCGILSSGLLKCWGENSSGSVGDGTTTPRYAPVAISDNPHTYEMLSEDGTHFCGVTTEKLLRCWGKNNNSQLGNNLTANVLSPFSTANLVPGSVLHIAVNYQRSCAITANYTLKCWGLWSSGGAVPNATPTSIDTSNKYFLATTGEAANCGIQLNGTLRCWGQNAQRQVGDGTNVSRNTPVTIDSGVQYQYVSAGQNNTCGITVGNDLKCWGYNANGEVGNNSTTFVASPIVIDSGTKYTSVNVGRRNTCALSTTGVVKCWGVNSNGALGDSTTTTSLIPIVADSGTLYRSIKAADDRACGITISGALKCWGNSAATASGASLLVPTIQESGTNFNSISDGYGCGITTSDVLRCWRARPGASSAGALTIDSGISYKMISINPSMWNHACGITTAGHLKCWGQAVFGQTGLGYSEFDPPTLLENDILDVDGSQTSICRINLAGRIFCSGGNTLGNDTGISRWAAPAPINSNGTFAKIQANYGLFLAMNSGGELYSWGAGGQVGDGTGTTRTSPFRIEVGLEFSQISGSVSSGQHACAITKAGVLKCWGKNTYGALGNNSTSWSNSPVVIDAGVTYQNISAGFDSTCGVTTAGVLKCWGRNTNFELGDGTATAQYLTPQIIDSGESYKSVSVAGGTGCGITTNDDLKCWGTPQSSQLGHGSASSPTPVIVDSGVKYQSIEVKSLNRCGVTLAGVLKCWGYGAYGANGIQNSSSGLSTPTVIDSGVNYKKIKGTESGSWCGITDNNQLKCWGLDTYNQMGLGRPNQYPFFVPNLRHDL